jgi:hypothetical protein
LRLPSPDQFRWRVSVAIHRPWSVFPMPSGQSCRSIDDQRNRSFCFLGWRLAEFFSIWKPTSLFDWR